MQVKCRSHEINFWFHINFLLCHMFTMLEHINLSQEAHFDKFAYICHDTHKNLQ